MFRADAYRLPFLPLAYFVVAEYDLEAVLDFGFTVLREDVDFFCGCETFLVFASISGAATSPQNSAIPTTRLLGRKSYFIVRRRGELLNDLRVLRKQTDVEPVATQIQSSMQHEDGPPRARSSVTR